MGNQDAVLSAVAERAQHHALCPDQAWRHLLLLVFGNPGQHHINGLEATPPAQAHPDPKALGSPSVTCGAGAARAPQTAAGLRLSSADDHCGPTSSMFHFKSLSCVCGAVLLFSRWDTAEGSRAVPCRAMLCHWVF